ncbi:MAG: pyridoxine 5'-phosphate synthase [Gammaproteobacteria bacterium]|nr:pyridoxine 5'-phosphate synthase [Gammaproteobacteria bacterium]
MKREILLGVNIDHVATLRQARGTRYPDPVQAGIDAEEAGADLITLHLREDRRHIQERDVHLIKAVLQTRMNFEMAMTPAMLDFAAEIKPEQICLVPEKREELTTEGGLDVVQHLSAVTQAVERLHAVGSSVSLFIDPDLKQIDAVVASGAKVIELHTGRYADTTSIAEQHQELIAIRQAAEYAHGLDLIVNAGHGLHYHNVQAIAAIEMIHELNIGHAIIARSISCGLKEAVRSMRQLMQEARHHAYG